MGVDKPVRWLLRPSAIDGPAIEFDDKPIPIEDGVDREILGLWLLGCAHTSIAERLGMAPEEVRWRWRGIRHRLRKLTEIGEPVLLEAGQRQHRSLLRLMSFLLPRTSRLRVFEPAYQDLIRDFAEARQFKGKWARRWLAFCFAFQAALMVLDCVRALVLDKLAWTLPKTMREWWLSGPK